MPLMKPQLKTLPNGLRVLLLPMKETPVVTTMVLVGAGSEHEVKEVNGVAHFLEHMCFKGTEKRPSAKTITTELDSLGAQTNAFTGRRYTGYWAKGDARQVHKYLDVIADIYCNSTLPEAEIEKEKGVVIEEINMYDDMPQAKVDDVFESLMFGDTPQGRTILGTRGSVAGLTQDDLFAFRNTYYTARNTVLVIAGRFDTAAVMKDVKHLFKDIQKGKAHVTPKVPGTKDKARIAIEKKASEQTHLILGAHGVDKRHKDSAAQRVLMTILGGTMSSRLFQKLRDEMGACYYVHGAAQTYMNYGYVEVAAGIPARRLEEVLAVIREEIGDLKTTKVTEEELQKAKQYLAGAFLNGLETSQEFGNFYGAQIAVGQDLKTPQQYLKEIQAVNVSDVKRVAGKVFADGALRLALVGPVKYSKRLEQLIS